MALTKIKLNELTPKADPVLGDSVVISDSENSGKGALVEITDLQTLIGGGGAVDSVAGKTGVVTLDADDVSATASKLWMSDTQQSMIEGLSDALAAKAPLASPALTGTPTAPTAASGTNTTQIATTAFCNNFNQKWTYSSSEDGGHVGASAWTMHGFSASGTLIVPQAVTVAPGVQVAAIVVADGAEVVLTASWFDQFVTPTGLATTYTLRGTGSSIVLVRVNDGAWACIGAPDSLIAAAIDAAKVSPALTGTPTAPTAAVGTNTTQIATTEFVQDAVDGATGGADSVKLTGDQSIAGVKTFTSSPVLPTPTAGDDSTKGATTAFVSGAVAGVTASSIGLGSVDNTSDINKPVSTAQAAAIGASRPKHAYTGITTASTAIAAERGKTYGVNADGCTLTLPAHNTSGYVDGDEICVVIGVSAERTLAITSPSFILRGSGLQPVNTPFNVSGLGTFIAFVKCSNAWVMSYPEYELAAKAPLASPALTGTPTAPTAATGTNTTQLATTAFVQAATASAIYDLPVTRRGLVSAGTDSIIFETANEIDPAWYDETHVLNVSFFARNDSGVSGTTTFKLQLYDEATSTAHTIASINADTLDYDLLQASIYRASSSSVNCNIQYRYKSGSGYVSLAVGSYKLRVVCTSSLQTLFTAAQVQFTK